MPTPIQIGNEIKFVDIFEILPPQEGEINIYYGRIGTGKTYAGTKNILEELKQGNVVYANWKIKFEGYDERKSKWKLFLGLIGLKRKFLYVPPENFHFWDFTRQTIDGIQCFPFIDQLALLNDCSIHLDEGHIPFDSYEATRMSEQKRSTIFATRHYDRKLTIYTQRANSVHVNLRGNANRFYKCEKLTDWEIFKKRWIQFQVTEFQDLTSTGSVDESEILDKDGMPSGEYKYAIDQKTFWGKKEIYQSYETKYLRGNTKHYQPNNSKIYEIKSKESWQELSRLLKPRTKTKTPISEKIKLVQRYPENTEKTKTRLEIQ